MLLRSCCDSRMQCWEDFTVRNVQAGDFITWAHTRRTTRADAKPNERYANVCVATNAQDNVNKGAGDLTKAEVTQA